VKKISALALIAITVGCSRSDDTSRRIDTIVTPPVAAPATPAAVPKPSASLDCGVKGKPVITGDGIGELKKGRKVAEVKAACGIESDSQQPRPEGSTQRVLVVRVAGESVRAVVTDDKIWRIEISSPLYRTADALGIDTPLRKLARMRGAQFFPGEDGVYGFVADHCGISFRFSIPMRPPKGGQWTTDAIDKAHGDAAVDRVLVTGCSH
jgi:hypothetical protein